MAPRISGFLAKRELRRAHAMYAMTTAWLILLAWPIYITSALFAGLLITVFGSDYARGAPVVGILCCVMLLATACGPVDTVLLMGGRSRWSLLNTGLALVGNVAVDLLLVPAHGIIGAAVGWSVGIILGNILPLFQVHRFLDMHPFGGASARAALTAMVCFGGCGIVSRAAFGVTVAGCSAALIAGGLAYAFCLRAQAPSLGLDAVWSVVEGRRARSR
ncbi:MAG: polysaccharide biosynthesis C-terminal domain-containing protein [Nocardioidaceae bacterium]